MTKPIVHVVDDDPRILRAITRFLRSYDFRVRTYSSAAEFLCQQIPPGPACLVLDLKMPGINGLELQQVLAERGLDIPIVFVSGKADIETSVRAMKGGAVDFLTKPFAYGQLLAAVQVALARSRTSITEHDALNRDREAFEKLNRPMHEVAVAALSEDGDRLTRLLDLLQTRLSREVFSHIGLPVSATDPIIRRLQESRAEVVIVDVPSQSAQPAIRAIELIRANTEVAIFANGEMTQPLNIVNSMRAGASEYMDRSAGHEDLAQALIRFIASKRRDENDGDDADVAGIAVKKPKSPNLNSGSAAASLD